MFILYNDTTKIFQNRQSKEHRSKMKNELFLQENTLTHEFPRILAHRGTQELYTENGLKAFEYSISHGITGFETDFRLTLDNEVVVMHDSDIKRTTTGEGAVEKLTLAEIKSVRMKYSNEQVPTAEELFLLFDNMQDFYIELEMKPRYGELYSPERMDTFLNKLHALALKHLSKGIFVFTCFDHDVLKRMKALHPEARIGLIYGGLDQQAVDDAIAMGCYSIAPTLKGTEKELVDKVKAAGLKVNLWHSETLELWLKAREMGADVSTNNHPATVLNAIKTYAQL